MTTGLTDVKVTTAAGGPDGMPLALKLNEGLGVNVVTFQQAIERRFKKGTAFVVDSGSEQYLDGIECRYAVYASIGAKAGDFRVVGYVFDRADALRLAYALTPNVRVEAGPAAK